jgi:predicted branched-subunit amino acid permease
MFIAIVVPQMKSHKPTAIAVFIAITLSLLFNYAPYLKEISVGFSIILCAVIASLLAAFLFPIQEKSS